LAALFQLIRLSVRVKMNFSHAQNFSSFSSKFTVFISSLFLSELSKKRKASSAFQH